MKKEPVFLGIYSRNRKDGDKSAETHWHVWGIDDGKFVVQPKVDDGTPVPEPETIDTAQFFEEFRVYAAFSSQSKTAVSFKAAEATVKAAVEQQEAAKENAAATNAGKPHAATNASTKPAASAATAAPASAAAPAKAGPADKKSAPEPKAKTAPAAEPAFNETQSYFDELDIYPTMQAQIVVDEGEQIYSQWEAPEKLEDVMRTTPPGGGSATYFSSKAPEPDIWPDDNEDPMEAALDKMERQLRSEFSIALIRLQTNRDEAINSFERMLENNAPFNEVHKHMFSDFGTSLRRRKLYSMSVRFHERAKKLAPDDEHILFNLARALYDSGKLDKAAEYLREAVSMASDFQAGSDFLEFIEAKQGKY